MYKTSISLRTLVLLLVCTTMAFGQNLKTANIFSDHMVLQRDKPVPVWGHGAPKEKVTVTFAGQKKKTKAGADGKWMVHLDPLEASSAGREMIISGKEEIVLKDIVVGEVWICSGQSNMAMGVAGVPEIKALVPLAENIRSFYVKNLVALEEQEDVQGQWETKVPASAVAFAFAYSLEELADVPVGIIQAAWGSSSIEAWTPRSLTAELPHFDTIMAEFDADAASLKRIEELMSRPDDWTKKENIFLRRQPNILYNAMIHPIIPFANRGLVWYQGERNTRYMQGMPDVNESNWFHRVCGMKDYEEVLQKWMLGYREQWQDDQMHFMLVMLPGYGKGPEAKPVIDAENPIEPSWAWMRESQMAALELPNVSVINTIDLGDMKNIHPKDKLPVGQRGALLAAKNTLGKNVEAIGPTFKSVEINGAEMHVSFDHSKGLKTTNNLAPSGFWISDDSAEWVMAQAKIEGEVVVLSSSKIKDPKYIRYAFSGKPTVNLVNESELPTYPFRTDSWEE